MTDKKLQKYLFLDFDETLFSHARYIEWAAAHISRKYHVDSAEYLNSFDEYHTVIDKISRLRLYDHINHMADTMGIDWQQVSKELQTAARDQGQDFCHNGAHDLISKALAEKHFDEVKILSFGDPEYQLFKIGLCSVVNSLDKHIVASRKGLFLASEYPAAMGMGVLMDDKLQLDMPSNWSHLQVNHSLGGQLNYSRAVGELLE